MNKVAVITGGSSGIGKALTERFAAGGYTVYELSRNGRDSENVVHLKVDISDQTQVSDAFEIIKSKSGVIDILINNAGFGISGAVEFTGFEEAKKQFDVNFFGTFSCIKAAIPVMRERGSGRIINVSSAAAVFPIPFQSFYSASKAAINSLTFALANELRIFGMSVCAIMPGDVKTGFTDVRQKNFTGDSAYKKAISCAVETMENDERNGMTPADIAEKIFQIAHKKNIKPLYTAGISYKMLVILQKILPGRLVNYIVGKIYMKQF